MAGLTFNVFGHDVSAGRILKGVEKQGDRSAKGIAASFRHAGASIRASLKGNGGKLAVAGLAAASAGIAGFARSSVKKFTEVTTESRAVQRALGGTLADASRWRFAAHEVGIGGDVFAKSMQKLDKTLVTVGGSEKANAALVKQLGFNFRDAHGHIKPMNDLLPQLSDKFASMPDGAEKTALAMKLFGKSGSQMLPFLGKGSKGLEELRAQSDKFGLTLNNNALDAVMKAKKSQREWSASLDGLKVTLGAAVLPILTKFVDFIRQAIIPFIVRLTGFVREHKAGFEQLGNAIKNVAVGIYQHLLLPVFHALAPIIKSIIGWIKEHKKGFEQLGKVLAGVVVFAVKAVITVFKAIIEIIKAVIKIVQAIADKVMWLWHNVIEPAAHGISKAWGWIKSGLSDAWDFIKGIFHALKQGITDVRKTIGKVIDQIAALWNGIGDGLEAAWKFVKKILDKIWGYIVKIKDAIESLNPFNNKGSGEILGSALDEFNKKHPRANAQGTGFFGGGVTKVGELGPEYVRLPRGAAISTATQTASVERMANGRRMKPTVVNHNTVTVINNNPLPTRAAESTSTALRQVSNALGAR